MNKFLHFNVPAGHWTKKAQKRKWQSRTVAATPPKSTDVMYLASAFLSKVPEDELFAKVNVGITFLSEKDNYNRAIGRQEALLKQKEESLRVTGVVLTNTHVFVNLETFQGVSLNLRTNKKSGYTTVTGELVGS